MQDKPVMTPGIISGRRDWDVVKFADYESDMRENGDRVLALHQNYRREIEQLKNTVWQLVLASGGRIEVFHHEYGFYRSHELDWSIEDNPCRNSKLFTAKVRR